MQHTRLRPAEHHEEILHLHSVREVVHGREQPGVSLPHPLGREAVQLRHLRPGVPTASESAESHADTQWRASIQVSTVWQVFLKADSAKDSRHHPHWRETLWLRGLRPPLQPATEPQSPRPHTYWPEDFCVLCVWERLHPCPHSKNTQADPHGPEALQV